MCILHTVRLAFQKKFSCDLNGGTGNLNVIGPTAPPMISQILHGDPTEIFGCIFCTIGTLKTFQNKFPWDLYGGIGNC
jgi:hypothetical protein